MVATTLDQTKMTKENLLFGVIGALIGLIAGFFITNSLNVGQGLGTAQPGTSAMQQAANGAPLPEGHPAIGGTGGGGSVPEVQSAIDNARQNPTDFEAQMKAAEMFYQIQRFDGAVEFLKKANEIQPDNVEVIMNLGNANFDGGKYEEAEKWYAAALAKQPADLDVRTDLGLTFLFREKPDIDRSIKEFTEVLGKDPAHVQALQNLTVAYTKKRDKANAEATIAKLEQTDPTNSALSSLRDDIAKIK